MNRPSLRKWIRPASFAALAFLLFWLAQRCGWRARLAELRDPAAFRLLVRENLAAAAALYVGVTVVGCVVLALPGVTFALLAGAAFGPLLGTALCSAATTAGAALAFLAGRFFLRDSLRPAVMKNRFLRRWLFEGGANSDLVALMVTRLVPVFPYNLQNFAYGITDIRFGRYLLYSFLFMLPGTAAYTVGSAGLTDPRRRALYFAAGAVLIVLVTLLGLLLRRRFVRAAEPAAQQQPEQPACVSCGKCTAACAFLRRRGLDFSDPARLAPLADHCFLCGKCAEVCPERIDGRARFLALRRAARRHGEAPGRGRALMLLEKRNYLFRSWRGAQGESVLFPGCSFPSFYPETTKKLVRLMAAHGIGTAFDCCGKPVAELGLERQEARILARLQKNLRRRGVRELVTVCPNCFDYLRGRLDVRVVSIYDKLAELGLGEPLPEAERAVFRPCPDRAEGAWLRAMSPWLRGGCESLCRAQCCGLGGSAAAAEPEAAAAMLDDVRDELGGRTLHVYCASCAGQFTRAGIETEHLLCAVLGSAERADVRRGLRNRAGFRFWRDRCAKR